jgi:glycosyltransferase involved in cell wall biosynthesis
VTGDAPPVTIGVPVRNGEDFLAEALDSALAQEYPNLVILISDNERLALIERLDAESQARQRRIDDLHAKSSAAR